MKRKFAIALAMAALGASAYLGSYLYAQTGTGAPPPGGHVTTPAPRTPVRIINLQHVVKNYNKWLNFQEEYKRMYKDLYEDKINERKNRLQAITLKLQDVKTPPAEREMLEKDARKLQREMQEISDEAKQSLGKREADMIVIIYKEIEDAVRDYARSGAIELVMHYNDATEDPELHSTANIGRKISSGGCFPLCFTQGMDISNAVLQILNSRVPKMPGTAGTTGTPGTSGLVPVGGTQPAQPRPVSVNPQGGFQPQQPPR